MNLRELPLSYMPQTSIMSHMLVRDCLPATFTHHSLKLKICYPQSFTVIIQFVYAYLSYSNRTLVLYTELLLLQKHLSPCWYFQGLQRLPHLNLNLDSSASAASIAETTRTVVLNAIMSAPCIRLLDLFRGELYCYQ